MTTYLREIKISMQKNENDFENFKINSSRSSYQFFKKQLGETINVFESVLVIYLDNSLNSLGWLKVSQGGINSSIVDVRLIMGTALKCFATGFIICHNHPSGNLNPSREDKHITEKLKEAGKLLDIQIMDHLIITEDNYFSFADDGMI